MSIVAYVRSALTDYMQPTAHIARAVGVSTRRAACCLAMLRRRGVVCSLKWDDEDPTSPTMWSLARHRARPDAESAARAIQRSFRKGMRARQRWRRQAARLIVEADYANLTSSLGPPWDEPDAAGGPGRVPPSTLWGACQREELARLVHQGAAFSAPTVRAYCERLVALASTAPVSGDWAESRGRDLAAKWLRANATRMVQRGRTAQRVLDTLNGRCPWNPQAAAQSDACSAFLSAILGDRAVWVVQSEGGLPGKNDRGVLPSLSDRDRGEESRLHSFRVDRDPNYIPF